MLNSSNYRYSAFLCLKDKKCVIIGGGTVAARKLTTLAEADATVLVVAPDFCSQTLAAAEKYQCKLVRDVYNISYIRDAFLVVAATDNTEINREISSVAPCLCNNITEPELSNFIVPSTFSEGNITVALVTGGMPAFTHLLKKHLQGTFTPALADFNDFLLQQREIVKSIPSTPEERTLFWRTYLNEELLNLVLAGDAALAKEKIIDAISSFRTQSQNSPC